MIGSVMSTALNGLQNHQRTFARHAGSISRAGTAPDAELRPEDMVGLMTSQRGYEANLGVLKRSDEMLGTLLEVLA